MFEVQMKPPAAIRANLRAVTVPIDRYPQGYDEGYANGTDAGIKEGFTAGKAAAEAESTAALAKINKSIREHGGAYIKEDAPTLADVPEKVPYVYDNGFAQGFSKGLEDGKTIGEQSEYDRFWDSMQVNGTRTDYNCAFRYWQDEYFHPKYKVVPQDANGCAYSLFQFMPNLKKAEAAYIDLSKVTDTTTSNNARALFNACRSLEEVEDIGLHGGIYYNGTFYNCTKLHTIARIRSDASTRWSVAFNGCGELVNLTVEGVIGQSGLSFADSTKLSKESVTSIINALSDSTTDKSITFSSAVQDKFDAHPYEWFDLTRTKPNWTIALV